MHQPKSFSDCKEHHLTKREAKKMARIADSIEINASGDRVWDIISDLDNEPKYWWGTRSVRNFSRDGEVVHREIYQRFGNKPILQKVILKPKNEIEIDYLKGITLGRKLLRLSSNESRQKLQVEWNIHFSGIYRLFTPLVAEHVRKGTRDALVRIKDASEGKMKTERAPETSSAL